MTSAEDKEAVSDAASNETQSEKSSSGSSTKKKAAKNAPSQFCCVVECGIVDEQGKRIIKQHTPYFGKEVEVFTACSDPKKRILYRASTLAAKFKCATNKVGMYLARRRNTQQGIFQAISFRMKPSGRSGLKAGGYFLSMEVCLAFEEHYNQQCKKRGRKGFDGDDDLDEGGEAMEDPENDAPVEEEDEATGSKDNDMSDTAPMLSPSSSVIQAAKEGKSVEPSSGKRDRRSRLLRVEVKSDVDDAKSGPLSPSSVVMEAVSVLASMGTESSTSNSLSPYVKSEPMASPSNSAGIRRGARQRKVKHYGQMEGEDVDLEEQGDGDDADDDDAPMVSPRAAAPPRKRSGGARTRGGIAGGAREGHATPRVSSGGSRRQQQARRRKDADDDDWSEQWETTGEVRQIQASRKRKAEGLAPNPGVSSFSSPAPFRAPPKRARNRSSSNLSGGNDEPSDEHTEHPIAEDDQPLGKHHSSLAATVKTLANKLEDLSQSANINALSLSSLSALSSLNQLNLPYLISPATLQLQLAAAYGLTLPALQRLSALGASTAGSASSVPSSGIPTAAGLNTFNLPFGGAGGVNLNTLSLLSPLGLTSQIPLVSPTSLLSVPASSSASSSSTLEQQLSSAAAGVSGLQSMSLEQARRALQDVYAQQAKQFPNIMELAAAAQTAAAAASIPAVVGASRSPGVSPLIQPKAVDLPTLEPLSALPIATPVSPTRDFPTSASPSVSPVPLISASVSSSSSVNAGHILPTSFGNETDVSLLSGLAPAFVPSVKPEPFTAAGFGTAAASGTNGALQQQMLLLQQLALNQSLAGKLAQLQQMSPAYGLESQASSAATEASKLSSLLSALNSPLLMQGGLSLPMSSPFSGFAGLSGLSKSANGTQANF